MATKKDVVSKTTPGTLAVRHEWEYPFASFQRKMNKLVDDFFGGFILSPWTPLKRGLHPPASTCPKPTRR